MHNSLHFPSHISCVFLCATRARVKLLEESAAQRETQARQECEDLMERLATATRSAERERSELQAQYQRKLAQAQQDRDREVERLRDLQRYTRETRTGIFFFYINKLDH